MEELDWTVVSFEDWSCLEMSGSALDRGFGDIVGDGGVDDKAV